MEDIYREAAKLAKDMAVEKYKAGDLAEAKEYAVRARILNPELAGLKRLNAVLDLLIGFERKIEGEPDWYAVLSVEPTADAATIHNSYRRLFLDIVDDGEDESIGSIDLAKKILVDSWKFLCDQERKNLYDERRREKILLRSLRRGAYEEQVRIRRASQVPSLTNIPLALPRPAPRLFDPPRRLSQEGEPPLRFYGPSLSQFPSLAWSARKPEVNSQRLFDLPEMLRSQENEEEAEVKAEQMAQLPLRIFGPVNQLRRGIQFPSLTYNPVAYPAPNTVRLFDPPEMVSGEKEGKAEAKAEQMVQERPLRGGEQKRKAPPLIDVIHHVNQLRRVSEEAEIRAINRMRTNLMNSQDVLRRALAEKAKSMINNLVLETYVFTSRQANGGPGASATMIPQYNVAVNEEEEEEEEEEPDFEFIDVEDPDFYNFDVDRTVASFGENQVWASYDDDGMPRCYAFVHGVISRKPFKLFLSWLNSKNNDEIGDMKWVDSGFRKTCGRFSTGRCRNGEFLINSFSHRVQWTRGDNGFVHIYPKKGDVWALYTNWSPSWCASTPMEVVNMFEMVQVIQDFDQERDVGVAVAPLVKVPGFKTVFRRLPDRRTFPRNELFRFSHQVPSRLLTGQEGEDAPEGCLELDPAALSPELLKVFTEEEMENVPKEEAVETMNNNEAMKKPEEET